MSAKVPIRTVFDGSTATGLAEYQSGEFIGLAHGGLGASLSIGSAGQVLKVNSGGSALEFGGIPVVDIDSATDLTSNTLATSDLILVSDGGTEGKATLSQVATAILASPTITGTAVMASLDISGDVDVDGTLEADAITVNGATLTETITDLVGGMVSGNTETGISVTFQDADNTLDFALGAAQTTITSLLATDIKIGEDDETKIDFETANEIHFYASNAEQVFVADGVFGPQTDSDVDLGTTGVRWKDAFIDSITTTGNVTVGGDLTITGDDLVMGTNTSGHILVADGTNFNPIAVTDLSEISTVASGDTLLAVDASGGGLKKITRSTLVAGLATSSAISNLSEDSTPQLGGDLDLAGSDIVTTSNATLDLAPNGTGTVVVRGNTNSGRIVFNCESNSHGQTLASQPHSASVTNTMLLPAGADSTLVSLVSTDTLTNKTLTSPVINTGTFGTSILPTSADGTTLGSASKEFSDLFLADGGTIQLGNDQDVTLTHVADTGILLNTTSVIQFRDSAINIGSPADGDLDINADDEIELNSTLIDINGNVEISGTTAQVGVSTSTAKDIFNAGMSVKNGSSSAGFIEFFEDSDNGTNKVTLIGPASTSDVTLTLGSTTGTVATTDDVAGEATALAIALG
tara:strand:+ start:937 stop:2841 length:1905 start_codon:yes stop_codon:yes gene_type:complete